MLRMGPLTAESRQPFFLSFQALLNREIITTTAPKLLIGQI